MDFLKGIKNSITDYTEEKKLEKDIAKISDISDRAWECVAALSDNPDFKLDYDNMSREELDSKLDYYADRVKKYMEGQIDPHKDHKRFNDDFSLFQHIATKSDKYDLLVLDSYEFFDKTNEEYNDISKAREEVYISEARDIIEGKTDPEKRIERVRFLLEKFSKHEWCNFEIYGKLCDIENEFSRKELIERLNAVKSKQKPFDATTKNEPRTSANEIKHDTRNVAIEKELLERAEVYLTEKMSPYDNWPDYCNLLDLFEKYLNSLEEKDIQLNDKYSQLVDLGNR